jgi:hypothetical protein
MKTVMVGVIMAGALCGQVVSQSATNNFAYDVQGTEVQIPGAWGSSQAIAVPILFHPPAGYQTRITRIYGNLLASTTKGALMPQGTGAEAGWGLKTTATDGSLQVTYPTSTGAYVGSAYQNTVDWEQTMINSQSAVSVDNFDRPGLSFVLPDDNTLICQTFVALNNTGLSIHIEPTFTVVYQFEPKGEQPEPVIPGRMVLTR